MATNSQRARLGITRRLAACSSAALGPNWGDPHPRDRVRALVRWAWSRLSLRRPLLRLVLATAGCAGPSPEADLAEAEATAGCAGPSPEADLAEAEVTYALAAASSEVPGSGSGEGEGR